MPPFRGDTTGLGTSSQLPQASGLFDSYLKAWARLKSTITAEKGPPELIHVVEEGLSRSQGTSYSRRCDSAVSVTKLASLSIFVDAEVFINSFFDI